MQFFEQDSWVWLPDEEDAYLPAKVSSGGKVEQDITVVTEDGESHTIKGSLLKHMDPACLFTVEDNILLELSEAAILHNCRQRYKKDLIYTYTSAVLISINPYKNIPIYGRDVIDLYLTKPVTTLPPHIFAMSQNAFTTMMKEKHNQSVICSGESGAGKTEAAKMIILYLTVLSGQDLENAVEEKLLEANPIMESFGNAKTIRNNNSSRFGKFIQIHFDSAGHICGASMVNYLLEKSRVVYQAPQERNYHSFYQLLAGANDEEKKALFLEGEFYYVSQGKCMDIPNVDDKKEFLRLKKALNALKIEVAPIFRIVAAVLHLGNVTFASDEKDNAKVQNTDALNKAASLLGLEPNQLGRTLIIRTLTSPTGTFYQIPHTKDEARDARDALAKALYGILFNFIASKINEALGKTTKTTKNFIGVLDIFGFECFEVNRFEQFCINYANEKLHQHFIKLMFKLEQVQYLNENINVEFIEFKDNQPCVELVDKKPLGILHLLDEECIFPKGTDGSFIEKVHSAHATASSVYYEKPKKEWRTSFVIKHYAGDIIYVVTGFLDKNKDAFQDAGMKMSSDPFIVNLFTSPDQASDQSAQDPGKKRLPRTSSVNASKSGKSGKVGPTVSGQFMGQLNNLMTTLDNTTIQYIRCVKPNNQKMPGVIEANYVLAQLRYSGMLECVKIRLCGYSVRRPFADFFQRFRILSPSVKDLKALVQAINIPISDLQIGKTKVFCRDKILQQLEERRTIILQKYVIKIQTRWRAYIARKKFKATMAALTIFRLWRGYKARKIYLARLNATRKFQAWYRQLREKREFLKVVKDKREREKVQREKERVEREKREKEERERKEREEKEERERKEKQEREERERRLKEDRERFLREEKEREERELREKAEREARERIEKEKREREEQERREREERERREREEREKREREERDRREREEREARERREREEREERERREREEKERREQREREEKEKREKKEQEEREKKEAQERKAAARERRATCSRGVLKVLPPEIAKEIAEEEVKLWLDNMGMGEYEQPFITAGYDDLAIIAELTEKDLDIIGITKPGHRKKIILGANSLEKKFQPEQNFKMEWTGAGYRKVTLLPGEAPVEENPATKGVQFFINLVQEIATRPGMTQPKICRYLEHLKLGFASPDDNLAFDENSREWRVSTDTINNIGTANMKEFHNFLDELGFAPKESIKGIFMPRKYITVAIPVYALEFFGLEVPQREKLIEFATLVNSLIEQMSKPVRVSKSGTISLAPPSKPKEEDEGLLNYISSLSWSSVIWGS